MWFTLPLELQFVVLNLVVPADIEHAYKRADSVNDPFNRLSIDHTLSHIRTKLKGVLVIILSFLILSGLKHEQRREKARNQLLQPLLDTVFPSQTVLESFPVVFGLLGVGFGSTKGTIGIYFPQGFSPFRNILGIELKWEIWDARRLCWLIKCVALDLGFTGLENFPVSLFLIAN